MKNKIMAVLLCAVCALCAVAQDFGPERYNCYVNWKWGVINMRAAHARITVQCTDGDFFGTMAGASIPWRGRVYSVSDTLRCRVCPGSESIEYVNGWYRKPKVGHGTLPKQDGAYRTILGAGTLSASSATMEAVEITANMLSMYYYARIIDFEKPEGTTLSVPISTPDGCENSLTATLRGAGPSRVGACDGRVYYVVFSYNIAGHGSAYPVMCEISADTRVSVYFGADIKIGHVEMILQ